MPASILLIDHDAAVIGELETAFGQEGFAASHAKPDVEAFRRLLVEQPDLVILGLDCQREDWLYCQQLLTFMENPLLLLLTTDDKLDRTRGLDLGADDCMIKPVLTEEVIARSRALLRRYAANCRRIGSTLFIDEHFVIDLAGREVRLNGQCIPLTPTEFRVLCSLAKHRGQVLSSDRVAKLVWGPGRQGSPETVKVYVHRLRKKLEADPQHPQRIVTRRGSGYLFSALHRI